LSYTHVRINDTTRITDKEDNKPFKDNKWVEIEDGTITKKKLKIDITSAAYLDTNKTADGFIDLIEVRFKFNGDDTLKDPYNHKDKIYRDAFEEMFKKRIKLNDERHFKVEGFNFINDGLLEIKVSQDTSKFKDKKTTGRGDIIYYTPKTDVDDKDMLSFTGDAVNINKDFEIPLPTSVKIEDKVAPVITIAYYWYWDVNGAESDVIDTLVVEFSEAVKGRDISSLSPEIFSVKSPRNNDNIYSPQFGARSSEHPGLDGKTNTAKFFIKYFDGDDFIVPDDSIQIIGGHGISDESGNSQAGGTNTVFAPIAVGSFHSTYEIKIFPNPYDNSSKKDNDAIFYYGSGDEEKTNVAIIAIPKGAREGAKVIANSSVTILDQLGNVVESGRGFNEGNRGAWIWTWDGRNTKKRPIGAGIYQAIIVINDGESTQRFPPRPIGIRNGTKN